VVDCALRVSSTDLFTAHLWCSGSASCRSGIAGRWGWKCWSQTVHGGESGLQRVFSTILAEPAHHGMHIYPHHPPSMEGAAPLALPPPPNFWNAARPPNRMPRMESVSLKSYAAAIPALMACLRCHPAAVGKLCIEAADPRAKRIAGSVWRKLEELFCAKSTPNKILQRLAALS